MGSVSLFAVLLLLFAGGTNAARLYPTSQEFNHETSHLVYPRLLQGLADSNESGSSVTYSADHWVQGGEYYGFSVTMDVYDLLLTGDQYSFAGIRICNAADGAATSSNGIQIGWEVSPGTYGGDSRAHLTAAWTTDDFQNVCINTDCPGFEPEAGAPIVLGDAIEPVSQAKGVKQNITIKVIKDSASGDWLVHCVFNQPDSKLIGRYPKSLFTDGLADRATHIYIGGAVIAPNTGLVPMGSGYLPTNDTTAASFSNIQIIDQNGQASFLNHNLPGHMSLPDMYSVSPVINGQFFYGGPYRPTM